MSRSISVALALLLPTALACSGSHQQGPRPSYSNVITREELQQVNVRNLYEAIQQLRPRWLRVYGGPRSFSNETTVAVYQDEAYLGAQDVLQHMGLEGVYSIRYLDGTTAKATLTGLPSGFVQGAIIVSMRPPKQRD